MIKTALVTMTIVGCDCDAKLCEYIGETPAKWATIAKTSSDTALRDINDLLQKGVLIREPGGGRSTSYALSPDMLARPE